MPRGGRSDSRRITRSHTTYVPVWDLVNVLPLLHSTLRSALVLVDGGTEAAHERCDPVERLGGLLDQLHDGAADDHAVGHRRRFARLGGLADAEPDADGGLGLASDPL